MERRRESLRVDSSRPARAVLFVHRDADRSALGMLAGRRGHRRRRTPPTRPGKRRGRPALESANPRLSALYSLALEALAEGGSFADAAERLRGRRDAAELAAELGKKINARLIERARDWERKKSRD